MSINSSLVKLADKIDIDGKSSVSPEYKNPNNSIEKSIERIADNYSGGGGTGGGVLIVNVEESEEATLTKTWQEIYDAYDEHKVVMLYWENDIAYLTHIQPATGLSPSYSVSFLSGAESWYFKCSNATDYPVFDED